MSSFNTASERIEAVARFAVPYAILALLVVFNAISLPYPFTGAIKPPLFLIALYYWCVYRPALMPVWFVFAAGILLDFLGGLPLGLNALVFVIARWVILDQRRFLMSQSYIVIWLGFCVLVLVTHLTQWVIFGVANSAWPPLQPLMFSVGLGSMLFPLISLFLHLSLKVLPKPKQESDAAGFSVRSRKKRR
ncbi:MAG: rod shape-determining protein MreD [Alphaproteobacteria bacterium]